MTDNDEIAGELQRDLRRLTVAVIVVFVLLVALTVAMGIVTKQQADDIAQQADATNDALCALRSNLQSQVDTSVAFLAEHPEGIAGIPVAVIQTNLANQQATLTALAGLECG